MKRPRTVATIAWAASAAILLVVFSRVGATGGVYGDTAHGDPATGVHRRTDVPRGDCGQCHDAHASRDGTPTDGPFPYLLFAPNDDLFCTGAGGAGGCHAVAGAPGIFAGKELFDRSVHATSAATVWPGPEPRARPSGDAGYCINCHSPHGRGDELGLVPSLGVLREERACLQCHDASGPAETDVATDARKRSRHPATDLAGRHRAGEGPDSGVFGAGNRHAECEDCHNPHDVRVDPVPPQPPVAAASMQRISRVSVSNGRAGVRPTYVFRDAAEPGVVLEFEVCFKCHSSWTTQPAGQPDLALLLNPANPSYHPVEAAGRDGRIAPDSFVPPWGPGSRVYCADCHGSDDGRVAGVHGSIYEDLLRGPYGSTPAIARSGREDACFACHRYDVYADVSSSPEVLRLSRWNAGESGHAAHTAEGVSCYACHDSHGSTELPSLIVLRRVPGLHAFLPSGDGATCASTCHKGQSYRVNYPR